ncbi:Hsp20/alpha crystallin family protein [Piscinibacter sp.]|jgi:HSP20 family protein|uniref:Hsp20/alpha crystallin family protein n=1 Tax=Piscinibacter sp. TaxID=1903157 RepID=UPI003559E0A8
MNALTQFERLDEMFPDVFRRMIRPTLLNAEPQRELRLDVTENDKGYEVRAEVPGATKEDIRVTIDRNFVSITAEIKQEKEEKFGTGSRSLVREIYRGSTTRSFSLAHEVDDKAAIAKYENGILMLSLPKRSEGASRTLNIQ